MGVVGDFFSFAMASSFLSFHRTCRQGFERKFITLAAEAADHTLRRGRNVAVVAKRLALVDVRQMDLDYRDAGGLQRVVQRQRGVGVGSRID